MLPITLTIPCALCFWVCVVVFLYKEIRLVCLLKQNKKKSYLTDNKSPTPNPIPKTLARPSIGIALI